MPEIVWHPEPTSLGTDTYYTNDGGLGFIFAFPLLITLVLAWLRRK